MDHLTAIHALNHMLLAEMPQYRLQAREFPTASQRLLRSLMNVRPPMPLKREFLVMQDQLLSAEREEKRVVDGGSLPEVPGHPGIVLWRGDITRLQVDAIVNAALLGCFCPCHGCIDNAIVSPPGNFTFPTRRPQKSRLERLRISCAKMCPSRR